MNLHKRLELEFYWGFCLFVHRLVCDWLIRPDFIHWRHWWVSGWGLESGIGCLWDLSQCCHSKVVCKLSDVRFPFAGLSCDRWRGCSWNKRTFPNACLICFDCFLFSIYTRLYDHDLASVNGIALTYSEKWKMPFCLVSGRVCHIFARYGKDSNGILLWGMEETPHHGRSY